MIREAIEYAIEAVAMMLFMAVVVAGTVVLAAMMGPLP